MVKAGLPTEHTEDTEADLFRVFRGPNGLGQYARSTTAYAEIAVQGLPDTRERQAEPAGVKVDRNQDAIGLPITGFPSLVARLSCRLRFGRGLVAPHEAFEDG
jgi:hypothetical protein